ncbi:MAG: hypothetical protein JNL12_01695 [Planctomycetes bacterium]|nr:hypothetical protein [Planctomycetota bacterium]
MTPPTGFTGNFATFTGATTCGGTGTSIRRNLTATVTTGEVGTFLGVSTGNLAQIAFDYKIMVSTANTVPAVAPWGTIDVQVGATPTGPWTTIGSVTDEAQTGACLNKAFPFTPTPGPVFFRFNCTRTGGTNYWNFDNIEVVELVPCVGTPNPGNTVGPTEACAGANFTLSLQNNVTGTGITYQWYESAVSGTGPWTSIPGANSKTYATSQTVSKWYYCEVICASGPSTGNSTPLSVPMAVTTFPQDWSTGVVTPNCWTTQQIAGTGLPLYSTVSGYGLGTGSVQFNFFTQGTTTENAIVSPEFAPVGPGNFVQFDAAGAHWAAAVDLIFVEESPDGGTTWNTIATLDNAQAGGVLNTALFPGNTNYTAAQVLPAHWVTLAYPLAAGTNRLRLRGDSQYGNNLYFDNLLITNSPPAYHATVGVGCYDSFTSALVEEFATTAAAKAKLDGNALTFINTGTGYLALWVAGGGTGFVAPSGTATQLTIADDGNVTITPTQATTVPGVGSVTTWNVASNGVLTAGATANIADAGPSRADVATSTGLAFYSWRDWNSNITGSGKIKWEEIGTTIYVTWDGVYAYGTTSDATTFQFQIDTTTGNVTIVWTNYAPTATGINVVGATLAGASITPPSLDLTTAAPFLMGADMQAMKLAVSGRPINNGTPPNYTISNIPEYFPGAGFSGLAVVFGFTPIPGGVDLGTAPFDIGAPGCSGYTTPDVIVIIGIVPAGPVSFPIAWSIPGVPAQLWMQAVSEFTPGTLPNGQNVGGKVVSNALEIYIANS